MDNKTFKHKKVYIKPKCVKIGGIKDITRNAEYPGEEDDPLGCNSC
jgi:hypothetical protein